MKMNRLLLRYLSLCLLLFLTITSNCSCSVVDLDDAPQSTIPSTTEGKLYREFPAEGVKGNIVMEEVEPLDKTHIVSIYYASLYEKSIESYTDLVIQGTVLSKREISYSYVDSTFESEWVNHASLIELQVDRAYMNTVSKGDKITIYLPASSHYCDQQMQLPEVGDRFYWLLMDINKEGIKDPFRISEFASYQYVLPSDCLLPIDANVEKMQKVISYYQFSAQSSGKECEPNVFELSNLDEFFSKYYRG